MEIGDLLGFESRTPVRPIKGAPLWQDVPESVKDYARKLRDNHWQFWVVRQTRGYCNARQRLITIPLWVIRKDIGYKVYYIAHELAHAMDNCRHDHGPEFMEWFKQICPKELQHYELGYKPRNAKAAGISYNQVIIDDEPLEPL